MLFDNIIRQDQSPRGRAESLFSFLNRSPRQSLLEIRNLLEAWFFHYPLEHQGDLKVRFCTDDDLNHQSAFFELYMHQLLLKMDYEVDIHPEIKEVSKHPEFLVFQKGKPVFYLECTLAVGPKEDVAAKKRERIVYETLDKTHSPNFFLEIKIIKYSKTPPSGAKWRRILEAKLSELDPDELQIEDKELDSLPKWTLKDKGWEVDFIPIPKSDEARGKPGIRPVGITWFGPLWVKDHIHIRNSINEKSTKYGDLDLPYIIAVNVISYFLDDISIENALFGDEVITATRNPDGSFEHKPGRKRNGSWLGPKGPQNTRVSGAVIFDYLLWGNIEKTISIFWHNPWAKRPLSPGNWPLPQKKVDLQNGNIKRIKGKKPFEIFNLPVAWPFIEKNKD